MIIATDQNYTKQKTTHIILLKMTYIFLKSIMLTQSLAIVIEHKNV